MDELILYYYSHVRGLHELVAVLAILVYEASRDGRVECGFLYTTPARRVGCLSDRHRYCISLRPVVFCELFRRDLRSASMTSFVVTITEDDEVRPAAHSG